MSFNKYFKNLAILSLSPMMCCCHFLANGPQDLDPDYAVGAAVQDLQSEARGEPVIRAFGDKSWSEYWRRRYRGMEIQQDFEVLRLLKQKRREMGLKEI
jgi:acyl carrier protein phosphodiesterase